MYKLSILRNSHDKIIRAKRAELILIRLSLTILFFKRMSFNALTKILRLLIQKKREEISNLTNIVIDLEFLFILLNKNIPSYNYSI